MKRSHSRASVNIKKEFRNFKQSDGYYLQHNNSVVGILFTWVTLYKNPVSDLVEELHRGDPPVPGVAGEATGALA